MQISCTLFSFILFSWLPPNAVTYGWLILHFPKDFSKATDLDAPTKINVEKETRKSIRLYDFIKYYRIIQ